MSHQADNEAFESAIYRGFVRHRRFTPRYHEFKYPLMMMWLKLDELDELKHQLKQFGERRFHWARFKRKDYIGDEQLPVAVAVKQKIAELSAQGTSTDGEVFLLGQLRYFGLYFSPLNLYYLRQNGDFRYMLAEVSNTPWNQRHYYLVDLNNIQPHDKAFHVSPFNPMEQRYHWKIRPPCADQPKTMLHLESRQQKNGDNNDESISDPTIFDATMVLKRQPLNQKNFTRVLLKTPIETLSIVSGIYWQAVKLFLKRVPIYSHPDSQIKNEILNSPKD